MKRDEQVSILLKAVRGVLADDELTKSERGEVAAEVLSDYAERTGGRDGLADISSLPHHADLGADRHEGRNPTGTRPGGFAWQGCGNLRKAQPNLSKSQAFARVYEDPANAELAQIERSASLARFAEQATSQSGDNMEKRLLVAKRDNALDALKAKAAELRKARPELSESQAFAKVYEDPANRALAEVERECARAALYAV